MSLYRQAGGRGPATLIAAVLAALLVGGLVGFLAGRGSVEDRSAAEAVADARAQLRPVAAGLELAPIEYEGALRGGRVVARTEYEAAREAVSRVGADLERAGEDLRAIDPSGYARAKAAVARLRAAIAATAAPVRVEALAAAAAARVEALSRPGVGGGRP